MHIKTLLSLPVTKTRDLAITMFFLFTGSPEDPGLGWEGFCVHLSIFSRTVTKFTQVRVTFKTNGWGKHLVTMDSSTYSNITRNTLYKKSQV